MFTRYPEGLASALEKLGGSRIPQADQSKVTAPMYIVRPLQSERKRSLKEAFSTHPPLEKRIKILRSMGGQAGFQAYDRAFGNVLGGGHVIGSRSLAAAPEQPAATPEETPAASPAQRMRKASDAYLAGAGYAFRDCPGCGAKVKIPPALAGRLESCPRCGTRF
jgi:heat shock protein HtpX